MFDASWLNIGSLVFGLISWALPIVNLTINKKQIYLNWAFFSFISISACAISICLQIFYQNYLVRIEDWPAIMDTMGSVAFISTALLIVTISLNVISFMVCRNKTAISS
ncbi:hypothetical protein O0Q50_23665 [Priestia aryabhattai]|uniref:Cytochrome c oxidase subunit 4 n=1 Tax=Priestia aryabhattai TaxID=412384 RepID=A0AAX6NEI3_PRIAR|nr:hypothetical protein [Priestia aryabhattai]MDU9694187.1 hypothetical protein [Priestia aryabhattai]